VGDVEFNDGDDSYLEGHVITANTHSQFMSALAQHRDDTGLPVVVDFYSDGCGPCRMIAPYYSQLAAEYKGRAVFLKVNVDRNWETSQTVGVSAMPTFHFYYDGQKVQQFQGADQNGLKHYTQQLVEVSEQNGVYPGMQITKKVMDEFYKTHPPGKEATAAGIAEKYKGKTAKLMKLLKEKYGETPTPVIKKGSRGKRGGKDSIYAATLEQLQDEIAARKLEEQEEEGELYTAAEDLSRGITHKVVVVGAGPAGLSAAIYAARSGLEPVVIAPQNGGQLLQKGVDVENYPGVHGAGATGRDIIEGMRKQAAGFKTLLIDDAVSKIDLQSSPLKVTLNSTGETILTHAVILATGADSRWLGVPGEYELRGLGVSSCATCDGFLFRGKQVAVIGGGDSAMEDALVLARTSEKVTVIHRRSKFRSVGVLAQRVLQHEKIEVVWDAEVSSFNGVEMDGSQRLSHINLKIKGGGARQLPVDAAFVAIGHVPNTQLLDGQLETDSDGYLSRPQKYSSRTSVPGVFAAGDVQDKVYRQAVTSAGTGAMAALDAERWLSEEGKVSAATAAA